MGIFCLVIDFLGNNVNYIKKSKLQSRIKTDNPKLRGISKRTFTRNWLFIFIQTMISSPMLASIFPLSTDGMSGIDLVKFLVIGLILFDFIFTGFHRMFHEIKWLYVVIHKQHHIFKAPFVWMSHSMHIVELCANGISVMLFPFIHALILDRPTPLYSVWLLQVISQLIGCIDHSGYDNLNILIIVPLKIFPTWLFTTTRHHDQHHELFNGNYGGYIALWDIIMKTEIS